MDKPCNVLQLRCELAQFTGTQNLSWLPSVNNVPDLLKLKPKAIPVRDGSLCTRNNQSYHPAFAAAPAPAPMSDQQGVDGSRQMQTQVVNPDWDPVYQEDNEFC